MNILKTLQQLGTTTERYSVKQTLVKCREMLQLQIQARPFEIALSSTFLVRLQALNLQSCPEINSTTSALQSIFLPFRNTCFKESLKEKRNNFQMQCILCYSRCIVVHFQVLQHVHLTDR